MATARAKPARRRKPSSKKKKAGFFATFGVWRTVGVAVAGMAASAVGSMGYDWITPGHRMDLIVAEVRANKHESDSLFKARKEIRDSLLGDVRAQQRLLEVHLTSIDGILGIWQKGECLDRSPRDQYLMGLTCPKRPGP